ncbi:hypothetical protein [Mucilaginibacter sp. UYCu711]|uniref:hypothetical protein n=1 Tax=Mucilaginibacter sp. UYCu711 TaxID=3156339 RepID=UPI003D1A7F9B
MKDKEITDAIKNKRWVKIQYHEDNDTHISIKPIFTGDSSYGDYFVYAWAWHSGQPGYYRFDLEKIHKVVLMEKGFEDDSEKGFKFEYPSWVGQLHDYRDDYLTWI